MVDDDEDARSLLATILTGAGAEVQTVGTAREALIHLGSLMAHVLLSDIGMPGDDGHALIREIRKREAQTGQHLPAAAITAYAGSHDRERALAAGFDSYLSKPIDPVQLVRMVFMLYGGTGESS